MTKVEFEERFGREAVDPLFDLELVQCHRHNGRIDLLPSGERVLRGWEVFKVAVIDGEEVPA